MCEARVDAAYGTLRIRWSGRPSIKRGTHVKGNDHWSTDPSKTILAAFSFSHSVALGEAEVELAHMLRASIVDLLLTEDSNAMIFGTLHIARERGTEDSTQESELEQTTNIVDVATFIIWMQRMTRPH